MIMKRQAIRPAGAAVAVQKRVWPNKNNRDRRAGHCPLTEATKTF